MAVVFIHRVTLAVPRTIGVVLANGQRGRRPQRSGCSVTDVDRLRLRIAHRIVVPWRQPVRLAVAAPGEAESALAHHGSEIRRRENVYPWPGSGASIL